MQEIVVAKAGDEEIALLARMANRHGLVAGATGTGKTVSLRVLAEGFSRLGVPIFMADVKGDLASLALQGSRDGAIAKRIEDLQVTSWQPEAFPVTLWDLYGTTGHPVRTTISEIGPVLLARLLNLNEIQTGVLNVIFKVADDEGYLLLDVKDLQATLTFAGEHAKELTLRYGNISSASIGAIQRALLTLSEAGGEHFFGEPALNIDDLLQTDTEGRGFINILAADKLINSPLIYSTFLLWLLSEIYERLPECGDVDKPKLVFFFDEAHLLFDDAPKALLGKIEQIVRLVRSKGVGVYFVTQSPTDVPDTVLGQLGNRIQHALRAFTARDQKSVRAAAATFRSDGTLDLEKVISELGIGEALLSLLDEKGAPVPVQRAWILPPCSRLGAITAEERSRLMATSIVGNTYDKAIDRESAYEIIKAHNEVVAKNTKAQDSDATTEDSPSFFDKILGNIGTGSKRTRQGPIEAFTVTAARTIGVSFGRAIVRSIMGTFSRMGRGR